MHRFDFDERASGNLEDVPKYWEPLRPRSFPHYSHGTFDFDVGHTAPPSFHLAGEGRNVAYQYVGPETRIRANTDYRIVGHIRSDRLIHARACLSAHALDKHGRPIPGTLVRSRYVGGRSDAAPESTNVNAQADGWIWVELFLPSAPVEAYTIGVAAWVLQEPLWNDALPPRRYIRRNDVRGGAWFDDITIYALPRVQISTTGEGNILMPGHAQELRVVLADDEDPTLVGKLSITAADGLLVEEHPVHVALDESNDATRISVGHLAPGLYRARLDVFAAGTLIVSRVLAFARLDALHSTTATGARPFGVVIDPVRRSNPETELALLDHQAVRSVKLPVWTGTAEPRPTAQRRRGTDRLRQELIKRGFALTGVLFGPPRAIVRKDGAYVRPLFDLLSDDPDTWKEHLTAVVAPYASTFRWWQVGADGATTPAKGQLTDGITNLRAVMRPFITTPRLSLPGTTSRNWASEKLPVEQIALTMGSEVPVGDFPARIGSLIKSGYERVSVYVEPLPANRFRRLSRVAAWAQRIIAARHAGADTVFVPQTWQERDTALGPVTEPTEDYVVLRTIADVLGSATPGPRMFLADGVEALVFHNRETSTLAIWDSKAPSRGRRHAIQLGSADRRIDIWGRATKLQRDETGRQLVELSSLPVFVPGIERWLVDFRTSLSLSPSHVESGVERTRHTIEMAYKGGRVVSGRVSLAVDESWEVSPRQFTFSLLPQRVGTYAVEIRHPHNEPAGIHKAVARITLETGGYYLEVPLPIEIGLSDLDVWGLAVVEGDDLFLRHVITNRSQKTLSFRGSATVPGRERQYRPISNLRPGDTQSVEYHFGNGSDFIARKVRLVLREINDGPRNHNLELTVP